MRNSQRNAAVRNILRYLLVGLWASFTVALVFWWYIFGRAQLDRLESLGLEPENTILSHQRMLFWEGGALIVLVLLGGATLGYQVFREMRLARKIQLFFLTFAHELKTPLASLRLQAEILKDSLSESGQQALAQRLINDTVRLNLQLENSLFFAQIKQPGLLLENVVLSELVDSLRPEWPALSISTAGDARLRVDRAAMLVILRNLLQNAAVHGAATELKLELQQAPTKERVVLKIFDNGKGFDGDRSKLTAAFLRHSPTSGNGLGLYLTRELTQRMAGDFEILQPQQGFGVKLELPGVIL